MIDTLPKLEELVPHPRHTLLAGVLHREGAPLERGPEDDRRSSGGHLVLLGQMIRGGMAACSPFTSSNNQLIFAQRFARQFVCLIYIYVIICISAT